jgi:hypothetical protein
MMLFLALLPGVLVDYGKASGLGVEGQYLNVVPALSRDP